LSSRILDYNCQLKDIPTALEATLSNKSYHAIWNTQVSIGLDRFVLSESRHEWINDGLMAVFFFLVGLEIKKELLIGELSSLRKAAFPFIAAVGGAIIPALLYVWVTHGSDGQKGWGIPMATDIAFALGALALLGNRVPISLKWVSFLVMPLFAFSNAYPGRSVEPHPDRGMDAFDDDLCFCNLLIGYDAPGRSAFFLLILPSFLSVSFFLIVDIDSPHRGIINVQPENLETLAESLHSQ
jgi:hypothetical protein